MDKGDQLLNRRTLLGVGALLPAIGLLGGAASADATARGASIKQARVEFGGVEPIDVRASMETVVQTPLEEILTDDTTVEDLPLVAAELNARIQGLVKDYCLVAPRDYADLVAVKPVLREAELDIAEILRGIETGETSIWEARMEMWMNFGRYLNELENVAPSGI